MLHDLELQIVLLEHEILSFLAIHNGQLLLLTKQFFEQTASFPVEERTVYISEISEMLLQLNKRKGLVKEWQGMKSEIQAENHEYITDGILEIIERNLMEWLPYIK